MQDSSAPPIPAVPGAGGPRRVTLFLVAATLVVTLGRAFALEGTPFGDHVEYLERAAAFARGEEIVDGTLLRAIGSSLLYAPVIAAADALGVALGEWLFTAAALLNAALSCVFVVGAARLARALASAATGAPASPWVGFLAGAVALTSPTLIRFGGAAMVDVPASAALVLGVERALFAPPGRRGALLAGLCLGLAALFAFKTIPLIAATVVLALLVRGLEGGLRAALSGGAALLAPIAALAFVQAWSDAQVYGSFGQGIGDYLLINGGQVVAVGLMKLGLRDVAADLMTAVYNVYLETNPVAPTDLGKEIQAAGVVTPPNFYVAHFHEFAPRLLVPFAALGALLAGAGSVRRSAGARRRCAALLRTVGPGAVALLFAALSSVRGAKEMRLWLPVLPLFAAYVGVALVPLVHARSSSAGALGRAVALGTATVCAVLSARVVSGWPTDERAAFRDAAQYLAELPAPPDGRPLRVVSSYNWAVLFRTPANVELLKLPHQLDRLAELQAQGRRAALDVLGTADALVIHQSLLFAQDVQPNPDLPAPWTDGVPWASELYGAIARDFGVVAAFWDRDRHSPFGAILVLSRFADDGVRRGRLWRVQENGAELPPDAPVAARFTRPIEDLVEDLELSGVRAWRLPGDGLAMVELDLDRESEDWRVPYYLVRTALRRPDGTGGFMVRGHPMHGKSNVKLFPPGSRVTVGRVLAPHQGPLDGSAPASDLVPGEPFGVFLDIASEARNEAGEVYVTGRLEAMDPVRGDHAERDDVPAGETRSDDGYVYSASDGGLLLGVFDAFEDGDPLRLESPLRGR